MPKNPEPPPHQDSRHAPSDEALLLFIPLLALLVLALVIHFFHGGG